MIPAYMNGIVCNTHNTKAKVYVVRLPTDTETGSGAMTKSKTTMSNENSADKDGPVSSGISDFSKHPFLNQQKLPHPRLLVLLDMNGTLLLRNKTRVKGLVPDFTHVHVQTFPLAFCNRKIPQNEH